MRKREREKEKLIMKKKIYLAVIAVAVISMAGCGKKVTDIPAEVTSEPTMAPTATEEPEQDEIQAEEVVSETDDTGVYYGSTGVTELNVGRDTTMCTVKVPLNYIMAGAIYLNDGEEKTVKDLGATVTVEEGMSQSELPNITATAFTITSLDADPTIVEVLTYDTAEVGSYEDLKQMFVDGKDIGTEEMPVWMYDAPETSHDPDADFVVMMPLSDSAVLTIYYQGPLTAKEGKDVAAKKVCELVSMK